MNLNSIVQQLQANQQQPSSGGVTAKAATAKTTSTSSTTQSAADANATITANDFITLLVTELQNQDPTSDADPNAYVNQLINVNNLQQLISINQGVTTLDTAVTATPTSTTPSAAVSSPSAPAAMAQAASPAQMASAQASYGAFAAAPPSVAQGLDPTNPATSTHAASIGPVVPSVWRTNPTS